MKWLLDTYGVKIKLVDKTRCAAWPAGNYCDLYKSPITSTVCTGWNYWPQGSDMQIVWTGGKYWNSGNNLQLSTCPVIYFVNQEQKIHQDEQLELFGEQGQ